MRKKGKIPAPLGSTPQLCSYPLREYEHVPSTFRVLISSTRRMEISDFSNKALTEVLLANGTDTYGFTKNRKTDNTAVKKVITVKGMKRLWKTEMRNQLILFYLNHRTGVRLKKDKICENSCINDKSFHKYGLQ